MIDLSIKENLYGFRIDKDKFIIAVDKAVRNGDKSVRVPMYDYEDENSVKYIDIEFMYYKPTEQVFLFVNYNGGRIGFTRLYDGVVIEPYSRFINIVRIVTDICYELERKAHVVIH